jgi:hypothetical protein
MPRGPGWETHVPTEAKANPDALFQVPQAVSGGKEYGMNLARHVLEV